MSRKTDRKNYANGLGRNHEDEWENYVNGRKKQLQGGKCKQTRKMGENEL